MSSHKLRIETGRYGQQRINRSERYCTICNTNDIEDEFHFVLICPAYNNLRKDLIKRYYVRKPSVSKFIEMMTSHNKNILSNLGNYISKAFIIRNTFINNAV